MQDQVHGTFLEEEAGDLDVDTSKRQQETEPAPRSPPHLSPTPTDDVELRALESKLELLTIQRQLTSLKSQAFLLELQKLRRAAPAARRHSLDCGSPLQGGTPVHWQCHMDDIPFGRPGRQMTRCHSILLASLDSCQAAPGWPHQSSADSAPASSLCSPTSQESPGQRRPHRRSHKHRRKTCLSVATNGTQADDGVPTEHRRLHRCNSSALSRLILPSSRRASLCDTAQGCCAGDGSVYAPAWMH